MSGVCCDDTNCEKNDFCSFNAPIRNNALKYWACPSDPTYCGLEHLLVARGGISENIRPDGNSRSSFNQGQMCKYKLMFPAEAGDFDQISVQVTDARRVTIYAAEAGAYSDPGTQFLELSQGDSYTLTFPNALYLSVVSNRVQSSADFVIAYRFNDRIPEEVLLTLSEAERDEYLERKVII